MIADQIVLSEIRKSWNGVRVLQERIEKNTVFSFAQGAVTVGALSELAHNLPLLHACSVLNDTLVQLRDEGHFKCPSFFLGRLHTSSRSALRWVDWNLVREIVDKRNELAHRGALISLRDCARYIDAIEIELSAWKVI